MSNPYFKQTDPQYKMRLPPELKERIAESAKAHNRSMNADIVARLEKSFEEEKFFNIPEALRDAMLKEHERLIKKSFENLIKEGKLKLNIMNKDDT